MFRDLGSGLPCPKQAWSPKCSPSQDKGLFGGGFPVCLGECRVSDSGFRQPKPEPSGFRVQPSGSVCVSQNYASIVTAGLYFLVVVQMLPLFWSIIPQPQINVQGIHTGTMTLTTIHIGRDSCFSYGKIDLNEMRAP